MTFQATESLEGAIQRAGSAITLLRENPRRAYSHGVVDAQFTNWQSEVAAWRDTVALMDQSHHMVDHYVEGPDAFALLAHLGVNSFADFRPGMAKQYVAVGPDGYYIGDAVLFYLEENRFNIVGRRTVMDWVEYHAQTGQWDVKTHRDPQTQDRGGRPPLVYRYEVQGPLAAALMEKVTGQPLPKVKFFGMTEFVIAGMRVQALRHGMAGAIGFEMFGPWEEGNAVRDAILEAGEEFGLKRVGSLAYSSANLSSGWVPGPLPGIFHQEELKAYRKFLPASAGGSLAGSFAAPDISDYYVTPFELGYGKIVKFDHEFVGADALKKRAEGPQREKVTLVWDAQDMAKVFASHWSEGPKYKTFNLPKARYGLYQMDAVLKDGRSAGVSLDCGYVANERAIVSLACVDSDLAVPGTEVTVVWGEDPVSSKPAVEPHQQTTVRATVAPVPFGAHARTSYRRNG